MNNKEKYSLTKQARDWKDYLVGRLPLLALLGGGAGIGAAAAPEGKRGQGALRGLGTSTWTGLGGVAGGLAGGLGAHGIQKLIGSDKPKITGMTALISALAGAYGGYRLGKNKFWPPYEEWGTLDNKIIAPLGVVEVPKDKDKEDD